MNEELSCAASEEKKINAATPSRGADAVIDADLDYEVLGPGNRMLVVSATVPAS